MNGWETVYDMDFDGYDNFDFLVGYEAQGYHGCFLFF